MTSRITQPLGSYTRINPIRMNPVACPEISDRAHLGTPDEHCPTHQQPDAEYITVTLPHGKPHPALTFGLRWAGYQLPWFTLSEAHMIAHELSEAGNDLPEYDANTDMWHADGHFYPGTTVTDDDGKTATYYPLGQYDWPWEKYSRLNRDTFPGWATLPADHVYTLDRSPYRIRVSRDTAHPYSQHWRWEILRADDHAATIATDTMATPSAAAMVALNRLNDILRPHEEK